ncbi:MAG: SPFH domain-containing protein [Oscillospiraceae bacterium]|jgi:regulator of protease activity HflC (stomatin/prohibitin superfamily)|nr:SPFH domain-containing protein [Oscillospiraceae bacterium]
MSENSLNEQNAAVEKVLHARKGMPILVCNIFATLIGVALFVFGILLSVGLETEAGAVLLESNKNLGAPLAVIGAIYGFAAGPLLFMGLRILQPNEAFVLTLFGRYYGTLKGAGFFWVHPFCMATNPAAGKSGTTSGATGVADSPVQNIVKAMRGSSFVRENKRISLKAMTLNNERQKINDQLGNPVIIGIVVIWKVVNTAKAVFSVDNFKEFLSIQCDSALRDIVSLYPYDSTQDNEKSLRGSSHEIATKLKDEIQTKVEAAGLEIVEARITHLSYAQEIAAAMLQRQQASAIIDARQMIVEGAVGMVEMALAKLSENDIVQLDEERKAAMVSNLLVVLCGNKDAQPVVNSGSLY